MQEGVPWILALTDIQQKLVLYMKNCQQPMVCPCLQIFLVNNPLTQSLGGQFLGSIFVTLNAKKYLKCLLLFELLMYSGSPYIL